MSWLLRLCGLIAAVSLWGVAVFWSKATLIPGPLDVLLTFHDRAQLLAEATLSTTLRLFGGLAIGWIAATGMALISKRFSSIRSLLDGPVEVVRPIPPIALTPFFIVLLGLGSNAQVTLIALGSFMIFYVGWLEAFSRAPQVLLRSAQSLGFRGLRLLLFVVAPFSWPAQKPIWRLAIASGLALSVAAEYLGAQGGLGYVIRNARTVLDLSTIAAASITLGFVAILADRLIVATIDLTSQWTKRSEAADA